MKITSLQTKFILVLLGVLLAALVAAQFCQQFLNRRALSELSAKNLALAGEREKSRVGNLDQTIYPRMRDAIERGDMGGLQLLITNYSGIDGLLEYSIYDEKGVAAYSTSHEALTSKQPLPSDLKTQLFNDPVKLSRRTGEAFEIYTPIVITSKCVDCHDGFQPGKVGGVAVLRISTEALDESTREWADAAAAIRKNSATAAVAATLGVALLNLVLIYAIVKRFISKPLNGIIGRLEHGTERLNGSATEISSSSRKLAETASEQAAAIEETSSSLEEMSSMTRRNAENVQAASELAKQARTAAENGAGDMQKMSTAMQAIKTSSDEIAKIIKTIDEIAFQTNILALNAAVEAARAGEAGMGFAVVAEEVRNLAQRSAQAARETAAKIEGAIGKTAQGVEISGKVAERLNEIVTKARQVDELAAEVASASREQTQGITQINSAVGQMDKVTQSNAAAAEVSAAAAEELGSQASSLKQCITELLRLVGSGTADGAPETAPVASAPSVVDTPQNGHVGFRPPRKMSAVSTPAPLPMPLDRGGATPGLIAWDEATMATGVEAVDSQHQVLIQYINELHTACLAGTAKDQLMNMLSGLGDYAQSHFKHEEGVMQQHQCPARGQNKAAHIEFLRDYEKLVEIVKRDGASTSTVIKLKEMLGNWLKNHICTVDRKLNACVRQCSGKTQRHFEAQ
jgi:hemerythrin-like metal-binding protein